MSVKMSPYEIGGTGSVEHPHMEPSGLVETSSRLPIFPLHRLSNVCCSTGACREVDYWPMEYAQQGLLQLDQSPGAEVPVDLIAFSIKGASVILRLIQRL